MGKENENYVAGVDPKQDRLLYHLYLWPRMQG